MSDITFDVAAHLDLNNFSWPPANTVGPPLTTATQRQLAADFGGVAKAEFGQVTGVRAPGAKAPTLFAAIADLAFTGGAPPDNAAQVNYRRVLRLHPSGATWGHAWETFANVLPIPNAQRGCQDSVDLGAPDVTDQPEHWRRSRFFWMRSTATGQVIAAHGRRGRKGGAQLGVWSRNLTYKTPTWRPLARYLPLAAPLARRVNAYGCEIPASVLVAALEQFYHAVVNAGALDTSLSAAQQAGQLLSHLRSERFGPKMLVGLGFREDEAMGGALAPATADVILRFDLWAVSGPTRGSVCNAQSIGGSKAIAPADSVSFNASSATGSAADSIALAYAGEFSGERQVTAKGPLRWTVLAIPVLAFWYENVVLPVLGGAPSLASFTAPTKLANALAGGEKTVWLAQNFTFFARTGEVVAVCRAWMPPGAQTWLDLAESPAPWTWGEAKTPGFVPTWTELPDGCSGKTTALPTGVTVSGVSEPELRLDVDLDAAPCTGPNNVLPANMNRFRSWHHRRGAAMFAESIAVWPQASYPAPPVSTPPRIIWGNGAETFASINDGNTFTPLGARLAPGQAALTGNTALAQADTARWVTQGLSLMHGYDVTHVPPATGASGLPEPEAVLICVDDGGIFRAENTQNELEWRDSTWNIPRNRSTPLPNGLGPPSYLQSLRTSEYRVAWRRMATGALEVLAAVGSFRRDDLRGRVVQSLDRGRSFNDRVLKGLPEAVLPVLVSTADCHPAAKSLPAHAVLASALGHGMFLLPPSKNTFLPTGDFFAHTPSAEMLGYAPQQGKSGPAQHVSLRKRIAYTCFYDVPRQEVPDVVAFFANDPLFDTGVRDALEAGVSGAPFPPILLNAAYAGSTAVVQRKRTILRRAHAATNAIHSALLNCLEATCLRAQGAYHAFCSLNLPGVDAIQDGSAPGRFSQLNPSMPPELLALGEAMVDPTQLETVGKIVETRRERGKRIAERLWRAAGAVASEYAGVYRLEKPSGGLVDVQYPPESGMVWRQIAGLARANAWTIDGLVDENEMEVSQMQSAGFPQSWRSVTALAASPDGQLAVTCDTVRLNARAFEELPGLEGTKPNDPNRNLVFEGGVFLLANPTGVVPTPAAPDAGTSEIQLLFTHPAPSSVAFSGNSANDKQLFVALNVCDILERVTGGILAEAMIPVVGPFTSPFPVVRVQVTPNTVQYTAGTTIANNKFFELNSTGAPAMRWPVGVFRVSESAPTQTSSYIFSEESTIAPDADARAEKIAFAASHASVPNIGAQCLDSPANTGDLQFASVSLQSVIFNQCCSIQNFRFLKVLGEWLYCGRRGEGIVRARSADLALPNTIGFIGPAS